MSHGASHRVDGDYLSCGMVLLQKGFRGGRIQSLQALGGEFGVSETIYLLSHRVIPRIKKGNRQRDGVVFFFDVDFT